VQALDTKDPILSTTQLPYTTINSHIDSTQTYTIPVGTSPSLEMQPQKVSETMANQQQLLMTNSQQMLTTVKSHPMQFQNQSVPSLYMSSSSQAVPQQVQDLSVLMTTSSVLPVVSPSVNQANCDIRITNTLEEAVYSHSVLNMQSQQINQNQVQAAAIRSKHPPNDTTAAIAKVSSQEATINKTTKRHVRNILPKGPTENVPTDLSNRPQNLTNRNQLRIDIDNVLNQPTTETFPHQRLQDSNYQAAGVESQLLSYGPTHTENVPVNEATATCDKKDKTVVKSSDSSEVNGTEVTEDMAHLQQIHGRCVLCGKYSLYLCSSCKKIWYCSPECQVHITFTQHT